MMLSYAMLQAFSSLGKSISVIVLTRSPCFERWPFIVHYLGIENERWESAAILDDLRAVCPRAEIEWVTEKRSS